jgi:diguanylate cyclase (GGDEF)-like protein
VDGAVTIIILNACVALLFAVAFLIVRLSYPQLPNTTWFVAVYLVGMLTPIGELGVRFFDQNAVFVVASYLALLLSMLFMAFGLCAIAGRPLPWRAAAVILVGGIITRAAIWGGQRDDLGYEFIFQLPFAVSAALLAAVAIGVAKRGGGRLWRGLAAVFGFMFIHFLTKPIFAAMLGSGSTAKAYAGSSYALFAQATGGALIITAGLLVMLIVAQTAMGRTMLLSETDPLTGIANRRGLARQSALMIAEARRENSALAIVLFDLDHFKAINDSHGHASGDAVIKAFADLLLQASPQTAAIARLGGDEFVVFLDRTTPQAAWQFAWGIRKALVNVGRHLPVVTVSGGIAGLEAGDDLDLILRRADDWAYVAKQQGRDRIRPMPLALVPGPQDAVRSMAR